MRKNKKLVKVLSIILDNHNILKELNVGEHYTTLFENFYDENTFIHENSEIKVIQEVNKFGNVYRYTITYYENGKARNRNIRYIKKIYQSVA